MTYSNYPSKGTPPMTYNNYPIKGTPPMTYGNYSSKRTAPMINSNYPRKGAPPKTHSNYPTKGMPPMTYRAPSLKGSTMPQEHHPGHQTFNIQVFRGDFRDSEPHWHTLRNPTCGKPKQENYKFEASLNYRVSSSLVWIFTQMCIK